MLERDKYSGDKELSSKKMVERRLIEMRTCGELGDVLRLGHGGEMRLKRE